MSFQIGIFMLTFSSSHIVFVFFCFKKGYSFKEIQKQRGLYVLLFLDSLLCEKVALWVKGLIALARASLWGFLEGASLLNSSHRVSQPAVGCLRLSYMDRIGLLLTNTKAYLFTVTRINEASRKEFTCGCPHVYVPGRGKLHMHKDE